ncbi:Wzz/FepE/Etk N-terminal domain-containing protein [Pseudomonas sp. 148P]|uniref:Wzz/FepE/Etk N-terminal domain-containing protein n=1 Tax=Pseudomonas ulcerans TaxID=3115852 RepID=A0ABU7HYU4_9PSED|nr:MULTISPECIES: Wzz/FepE/Etk N-terminal domain-containing protein [unclassified Pseudomonas]MEE1922824.1 Wzz/FepE/Etk N-terminal domain-containing protein [Pseudomonas sp. 147P]MEE1936724.1 Wzz/FepE/Etk N-terminal domain-containing protein [Pseudomonas sp. 148P]
MQNDVNKVFLEQDTNIVDVLGVLWRSKFSILAFTLFGLLCSAVYLFFDRPLYEARVFVLPPTQNGIAELNFGRTREAELSPYSVKDVYDVFLRNLQAESLRREFFSRYYLPSLGDSEKKVTLDELYSEFSENLKVTSDAKISPDGYSLVVRGREPAKLAEWAGIYMQSAEEAARKEVVKNASREAEVRARNLNQQIVALRERGQKAREDLVLQLQEALKIAQTIGLENPPILSGGLGGEVSANMGGQLTYMRGARALRAEIDNLQQRQSDDPFIPELRALQVKYSLFRSIEIVPENVSVYRLDGPIETPDTPLKVRFGLILAIGVLLGGVLGVIFVLARWLHVAVRR